MTIPTRSDLLTTHLAMNFSMDQSTNTHSTGSVYVIQSAFKSPTSEHMRLTGDILDLKYNIWMRTNLNYISINWGIKITSPEYKSNTIYSILLHVPLHHEGNAALKKLFSYVSCSAINFHSGKDNFSSMSFLNKMKNQTYMNSKTCQP